MKITKNLLSGNIAGPLLNKKGNLAEQTKSLEANQITYKKSEVQYQIIHSFAVTGLCWITYKTV